MHLVRGITLNSRIDLIAIQCFFTLCYTSSKPCETVTITLESHDIEFLFLTKKKNNKSYKYNSLYLEFGIFGGTETY